MNKTKIEWALNPDGSPGYTWNPITGCLNGCDYCYARKLANGRLRARYLANNILPCHDEPDHEEHHSDPFYPRFWPEKLPQVGNPWDPSTWHKKEKGIFVCSMSDLFGIGVPEDWTRQVLMTINDTPHRYYLLTKQPQNLIKFSPFPDNVWVGVSATNGKMVDDAGYYLDQIEAKVKYLSLEPLLEPVKLYFGKPGIDWVIIGAQTKPTIMPKIEWVKEIMEACRKAVIPFFLKESLAPLFATGPTYRKVAILTQDRPDVT